jgi:hypothetical protein
VSPDLCYSPVIVNLPVNKPSSVYIDTSTHFVNCWMTPKVNSLVRGLYRRLRRTVPILRDPLRWALIPTQVGKQSTGRDRYLKSTLIAVRKGRPEWNHTDQSQRSVREYRRTTSVLVARFNT